MRALATGSLVIATLLLLSTSASAQPAIAGIVKDASGAILPGVSVEASSPVLIEKSRTVVTDGTASLAWGATVTGGASTKYLVWFNGAAGTVIGK